VIDPGLMFRFTTVVTLVTGTMFLMWLGEQVTEAWLGHTSRSSSSRHRRGTPNAIAGMLELVAHRCDASSYPLLISAGVVVVTWAVCFVERGQRKILVNYAKRQIGNKVYGGQARTCPSSSTCQASYRDLRLIDHPVSRALAAVYKAVVAGSNTWDCCRRDRSVLHSA